MWGRDHQCRVGRDDQVTITLAAVLGFLLVEIATRTAISMAYVGGAFVAATVLIGPTTPLGGVAGLIIHDGFHGTIGYWTAGTAAWVLAFACGVVWLASGLSSGQERQGLESMHRVAPAYAGIMLVSGVNATAFGAWLVMVLGAQRFYTAVSGFLPGVLAAVGFSVFGLAAIGAVKRLGSYVGQTDTRGHSLFESESHRRNPEGPTTGTAIGVFFIGTGWLFGVSALDVFVHDLGLYPTASAFRAFVTGFLGSGSPIATVGTTALLSVYNYGELAVVLSAPVALTAMLWWCTYHEQVLSSTVHGVGIISGGLSND